MALKDKLLKKNSDEIASDRTYEINDFMFQPRDVTSVFHDRQAHMTFVSLERSGKIAILDRNRALYNFCFAYLKPIQVDTDEYALGEED